MGAAQCISLRHSTTGWLRCALCLILALCSNAGAQAPWKDPGRPLKARVNDLLSQLMPTEKVSLMQNLQPPVARLGIKGYEFWSECLHGLLETNSSRAAPTLFPQPLVLGATFDPELVQRVFSAVSDELRAKNNEERSLTGASRNLVCWTPHINLFRDPRWGRGHETYGEDPHLTSRMAVAVVKGLQGNDPQYTKVVATCKHFMGYSLEGAEGESRFSVDATISPQDAADTYLPAFEACVREGGAHGVMCSYNAVNGVPSCANEPLLRGKLRGSWGFGGYVVTDCGAVQALTSWGHGYSASNEEALGAAVNASVDLMCDGMGAAWVVNRALQLKKLTQAALDEALSRSLGIRFRVGEFDPPEALPWAGLGPDTVNSQAHRQLAREAATKGIVLLKNQPPCFTTSWHSRANRHPTAPGPTSDTLQGTKAAEKPLLPLNPAALKRICVVGPLADSPEHMLGNYYGRFADDIASPLRAIMQQLEGTGVSISHSLGVHIMGVAQTDTGGGSLEAALLACRGSSVAIMFLGSSTINPKPGPDTSTYPILPVTENEGLDRTHIRLAGRQLDAVMAFAKRAPQTALAVVLMNAGPIDVSWLQASPRVAAIVSAGSPGQEGGHAIADVLFGKANPSGRLPVTWYHSNYTEAVSPLDMRMRPEPSSNYPGRSYRFTTQPVLYPFGHGLSYTRFEYSGLSVTQPTAPSVGREAGSAYSAASAKQPTTLSYIRSALTTRPTLLSYIQAALSSASSTSSSTAVTSSRLHRQHSAQSVSPAAGAAHRRAGRARHSTQRLLLRPVGDGEQCLVQVTVSNAGDLAGEEVVMVSLTYLDAKASEGLPLRSLRAFERTAALQPGASQDITRPLGAADFSLAAADGTVSMRTGRWRVAVGTLSQVVEVQAMRSWQEPGRVQ